MLSSTQIAVLKNPAQPKEVRQLSWDEFLSGVCADFSGKRWVVSKVCDLYETASEAVGVKEGVALQEMIRFQQVRIEQFNQQVRGIEESLIKLFHQLSWANPLLSIGLGESTMALIWLKSAIQRTSAMVANWSN